MTSCSYLKASELVRTSPSSQTTKCHIQTYFLHNTYTSPSSVCSQTT